MIDTIKLGIPLTQSQHKRILETATESDRWQWVQINQLLGEMRFFHISGLAELDQHSYHRELRWDIPPTWQRDCCQLLLEFSIPKFWYGHNVHLLYGFLDALRELKTCLEQGFGLRKRAKLPDPLEWQLYRVDLCYAWRLPSQSIAQQYLDSLKHIHYPRKRPVIYPTSIVFVGATYSLKFYLKYPEFRTHDMRELVKAKAALEWVNHLEELSNGVLRCEATLRRKYLKANGLLTVANLTESVRQLIWDTSASDAEGFDPKRSYLAVSFYYLWSQGIDVQRHMDMGVETPFTDGMYMFCPPAKVTFNDKVYQHPGGGCTVRVKIS